MPADYDEVHPKGGTVHYCAAKESLLSRIDF